MFSVLLLLLFLNLLINGGTRGLLPGAVCAAELIGSGDRDDAAFKMGVEGFIFLGGLVGCNAATLPLFTAFGIELEEGVEADVAVDAAAASMLESPCTDGGLLGDCGVAGGCVCGCRCCIICCLTACFRSFAFCAQTLTAGFDDDAIFLMVFLLFSICCVCGARSGAFCSLCCLRRFCGLDLLPSLPVLPSLALPDLLSICVILL